MADSAKNRFTVSAGHMRRLYMDNVLNIVLTIVFYVTFLILFKDHPQYSVLRIVITVLFAAAGIGIILLDVRKIARYRSVYYQVKPDSLYYYDGKAEHEWRWSSFTKVEYDLNRQMSMMYPCRFHAGKDSFYLNRFIDDKETLIPAILKHIRSFAVIDPQVPEFHPQKLWAGSASGQ